MTHTEVLTLLERAAEKLGLPPGEWRISPLQADGSDRRFFRARSGKASFVALVSPRRRAEGLDENDSYFRIGRHLHECTLPVPRILWADVDRGCFLLQDVGDCHLQRHLLRGGVDLYSAYRRVVGLLVRLHKQALWGFAPEYCFDSVVYDPHFVYERELEYFRKAFLVGYLGLEVSEEDLRADFERLAESAGVRDFWGIIHRDFQSRNIMVHTGGLWILDFQGMRYGPPVYDLASVLLDPYVALPEGLQRKLMRLYWFGAQRVLNCSYSRFRHKYDSVRLCRNLQVLAAYGYLGKVKGKTQFLQYIPYAWRQLLKWLDGPCRDRYPGLKEWTAIASRTGKGLLGG